MIYERQKAEIDTGFRSYLSIYSNFISRTKTLIISQLLMTESKTDNYTKQSTSFVFMLRHRKLILL